LPGKGRTQSSANLHQRVARCGVYFGAVTDTANGLRTVVNVARALMTVLAIEDATPTDFDDEDTETRNARRAKYWTPAVVEEIS